MTKQRILELIDEAIFPLIDEKLPVLDDSARMAKSAYTLGRLRGLLEAQENDAPSSGEAKP